MAHRLKHPPHFAVASLCNRDTVPTVDALATASLLDGAKLRRTIVEHNPVEQTLLFGRAQRPEHPHRVLALQAKARMHQLVGQFARAGQQQQAFGIEVQPSDRLPLALVELGQLAKDGRAVLRIVVGHHLAGGLVVGNHPRRRRCDAHAQRLAIDLDRIAELNALADVGRLIVDRNAALQNQLLHLQARAQTGLGQHLVQLGAFGLGREHALG